LTEHGADRTDDRAGRPLSVLSRRKVIYLND
jgi:hypothetical protein